MSFISKSYSMTAVSSVDELSVHKDSESDWIGIAMITNGEINGTITVRSKDHIEALHFMLGQLLGE